jgi:hypothetical protein
LIAIHITEILFLKEKDNAKIALKESKKAVDLENYTKIKAARTNNIVEHV